MGLLTHGLAAGFGYLLGRPDSRARLVQLGRQTAGLAQRPEVVRARERVQDQVKDQAYAVKQKVEARSNNAAAPVTTSGDVDSGMTPVQSGPRTRTWRSRLSRSTTAHFPSSTEARAAQVEGTRLVESPETPPLGTTVTPRPQEPGSP
jgi:hypothetical protein